MPTEDESDSDDIIMGDPLPSSPEPIASDLDELPESVNANRPPKLTAAEIVDIEQRLGEQEHVLREMRQQILASITIEDVAPFLPKPGYENRTRG